MRVYRRALTTGSEYAACRGKRGAPEGSLCGCAMPYAQARGDSSSRCAGMPALSILYTPSSQQRQIGAAMRDHIGAVAREHGYPLTQGEALQWVIGDEG